MKNKQTNNSPRLLPLVLIVIGTSLLAIPAAFGTFVLVSESASNGTLQGTATNILLAVPIIGFALHFGYILTLFFRRFFFLFWLASSLYNAALTAIYFYYFFAYMVSDLLKNPALNVFLYITPFLSWMIFMTTSSIYYARFSIRPKSLNLR